MSKKERILKLLKTGKSIEAVAKAVKVKPTYVYYIRWMDQNKGKAKKFKAKAEKPSKIIKAVRETQKESNEVVAKTPDLVNAPPHYKVGGIDTLDFIEAKDLNFRLANVVKYVVRCGRKVDSDPVEDLKKAQFYLNREIIVRERA